jgi:hypothetical protein
MPNVCLVLSLWPICIYNVSQKYLSTVDGQIKLGHLKFNLCKSDY